MTEVSKGENDEDIMRTDSTSRRRGYAGTISIEAPNTKLTSVRSANGVERSNNAAFGPNLELGSMPRSSTQEN